MSCNFLLVVFLEINYKGDILKKLPFHKTSFCLFIGLVATIFFAGINNFYFYKNKEYVAGFRQEELSEIFTNFYNQCSVENEDSVCVDNLKKLVEESRLHGVVSIEYKGDFIFKSNSHSYDLGRKEVGEHYKIGDEVSVYLGQLVTPSLFISTFNSVTFSLMDWPSVIFGNQSALNFAKSVAWPRSAPTFTAGILVFFVVFLIKVRSGAILDRNIAQSRKIEALSQDLQASIEKESLLNEEKESLKLKADNEIERRKEASEEINALLAKSGSLKDKLTEENLQSEEIKELEAIIEESWQRSSEYENEIENLKEELISSKATIEEKDKQLEDSRNKNIPALSKNQKKLIGSILLESPDVNKSALSKVECGKHHSKDYVKKLSIAIERNSRSNGLVSKVYPQAYKDKKRGVCELHLEKDDKTFYLDVYDLGDEGYAAKVVLSGLNHWQAIAETKYLLNAVRFFKGLVFEDKTGL